ncbi:hypothetical protein LSUE1_G001267 [Lachnellula suecica]|uniref:Uncharacterized protein n=1 Tax=Lachnellula suecica TaxID=602035 RepID=A0A8T9CPS3_9HELO|nr:hypothetical protein LSUE1_G001267 [Lachnellula suecica]
MAIPDNIQTLSSAFSFGILLQAASGALFIYSKGHGSSLFQDGRRLVLVLFLLFAALWAQVGFFNLMLSPTASGACQALLIFSTAFDQLARVGVEQYLIWAMGQGTKATAQQMILQGILALRLIAGGLLVGFTRPDFAPVCVARTSVLPTSIVVLALDFIIIGVLIIRAASLGMFGEMGGKGSSTRQEQSRALVLSIAGLTLWTGTSVPMILGIPSIILMLRTVLPANGLLILVGIVTMFQGALLLPREEEGTTPEAQSPFMTPAPPSRELFNENVNNGSPISGHNYTKSGNLFVVNPSSTPRDSPTTRFQSNFQGDTRGFTKLEPEVTVRVFGGDEQSFPESKNGPGYRGSSGVFPSVFAMQDGNPAAMPQIKLAASDGLRSVPILPVPALSAQQKRSLFNWSKAPAKPTVRKLAISQPVLDTSNESIQPFARMPTIDLATAAANERERREGAAARSRLVANRPAPQPPSAFGAQDGLRRSISTKRKEMPKTPKVPMPAIPGSDASGRSVDAANGSSTSASLSPGREEVRRRSPRNTKAFNNLVDEKLAFVAPPLQRKGTIGLPSNPRSQRTTMAREAPVATEPTVMLVNNIVYDNPVMVSSIMSATPAMYASSKRPKTAGNLSDNYRPSPTHSIIHRPRPIRRDSESERAIFPSAQSPRHTRSKSAGSAVGRSLLYSTPGSPTQLPPLPPPPTSASKLKRLLPNNTKSMTFDEKIELLFPAPPGAPSIHNRRSSVPSLPKLPSVYMSDTPHVQSPAEEDQRSRRASKRTTISSFVMPDVNKLSSLLQAEPDKAIGRQTYRFSANTYRNIADEVGGTWIPGIPAAQADVRDAVKAPPVPEPAFDTRQKSTWTATTASISSFNDDATTYWGSVHSEVPAIDLSKARQIARLTLLQRGDKPQEDKSRALPPLPPTEFNDGEEIMTVMFDAGEAPLPIMSEPVDNRRSFFLDADQTLPGDKTPSLQTDKAWHRRIGDELPTFSERKAKTRSRKMPPPTPLLLNKNGRQATVVVRNTEPSPIDSPELAIQELQAQLKRFEEPSRGSVGSMIRHLPNSGTEEESSNSHRLRLLDNLEKEMGQQENHWQQMQVNMDRDSVSVIMTPVAPSPPTTDLSREASQKSSRSISRVMSRRARIRSSMTVRSKGEDSNSTTSTQSSDNSRASVWQQRLAEAQEEYLEKAPALLRKQSLNFLSVSKSHQLGSPTPPDSEDSGTDMETDAESEFEAINRTIPALPEKKQILSLWREPVSTPKMVSGRLWNPPYEKSDIVDGSSEPPAMNVRPAQRFIRRPLFISSSDLWSKPRSSEHSRPVVGLWGSKLVRPRSIVTRPVTQKPQRKSRRVTFLPDIIESPVPLPNKRETLGIFQFPWGEKSDTAVYQPPFNPALLSGPAVSAKLDARSRQLESEADEYSTSFFDDYDEEDVNLDIDTESDDDFDETTLWEIASLLKSRDVPSKDSLLPPSRHAPPGDIIEDYDESDYDSESEDYESVMDELSTPAQTAVTRLPIQPLVPTEREVSQLWTNDQLSTSPKNQLGLTQPEESVWKSLMPAVDDIIQSKPRASESLSAINTRDLWTISRSEVQVQAATSMWSGKRMLENPSTTGRTELMWQARPENENHRHSGLFTMAGSQVVIRRTNAIPAAIDMVKAPRSVTEALPSISSRRLWSRELGPKQEKVWTSKPPTAVKMSVSVALMWTPEKMEALQSVHGLFDVAVSRSEFRTTTLMPAAINMVKAPRSSTKALPIIASQSLWSLNDGRKQEKVWTAKITFSSETSSVSSALMWAPARKARSGRIDGLFNASQSRSDYRKTELMPAALNMTCKPRTTRAPLSQLSSTRLWRRSERLDSEHHWISESSIRPESPSVYSSASSGQSSPASDSSSVKSTSTKASSIWTSVGSAIPIWWESKSTKKSPSRSPVEEPKRPSKIPLRQQSIKPMEPVVESVNESKIPRSVKDLVALRESRVLVSRDLAETRAPILENTPMKKLRRTTTIQKASTPAHKSIGHRNKPLSVVSESWDEALAQAVAAGSSKINRRSASTRADWAAALATAISRSRPRLERVNASPKMWEAALMEAIAQGLAPLTASQYDPSTRHPVFFTDKLVTSSTQIHPAAIGHVTTLVVAPTMWTAVSANKVSEATALWTKETAHRLAPITATRLIDATRKAPVARTLSLPALESSIFWQPARVVVTERHWLNAPIIKSALTWVSPGVQPPADKDKNRMWIAPKSKEIVSPDIFAKLSGSYITKSPVQNLHLPALESSEFWQPTRKAVTKRDWLNASKAKSCQTWIPIGTQSVADEERNNKMWMAPLPKVIVTPDMFGPVGGQSIKKSSTMGTAQLQRLQTSELFALAPRAETITHWLHETSSSKAVTQSLTWSPVSSDEPTNENGRDLWVPQTISIAQSPELFSNPHTAPWDSKKRAPAALTKIESASMWRPSMAMPESPKNWLSSRKISRVEFRY